jgi:hypothetical protein
VGRRRVFPSWAVGVSPVLRTGPASGAVGRAFESRVAHSLNGNRSSFPPLITPVTKPIRKMHYGEHRVSAHHPGAGEPHYGPHLLLHLPGITVDAAAIAGGLGVPKDAPIDPRLGVREQGAALPARSARFAPHVVRAAVHGRHDGDGLLFPTDPS